MDISKRLKTYQEALIALALKKIYSGKENVYWNQSIGPYYVEPDITVGKSPDAPILIACIAHSDSEKESDKKFWRNAAELSLSKALMTPTPMVINLIFESHYKPELLEAMQKMFDAQARIQDDWGLNNLVILGPELISGELRNWDNDDVISYLENIFIKRGEIAYEFEILVEKLRALISPISLKNSAYWESLRKYSPARLVVEQFSFESHGALRRGISKLVCFQDKLSTLRVASSGSLEQVEGFAIGLGWAQPTIVKGKARIIDQDIISLAKAFDHEAIVNALSKMPDNVISGLERVAINPTRQFGEMGKSILAYYLGHSKDFEVPQNLKFLLISCFSDPSMSGDVKSQSPWIIDFCLAAGKAVKDRPQGYGLSQLAKELQCDQPEKVRFWIPDYNAQKQLPSEEVLDAIADALSGQFKLLHKKYPDKNVAGGKVLKFMSHTLIEVKLCTYRLFRPAEELFSQACINSGFAVQRIILPTNNEFSESRGGVGTEGLLIEKDNYKCYVKVQSGAKNTHDKAKELCGRFGLSLQKTAKGYSQPYEMTLLVLDGPFSYSEARMCFSIGWNKVVSLDEINQKFLNELVNH